VIAEFDLDDPLYKLLTIAQAMEATGRTRRTIDKWIKKGELQVYRLGYPPVRYVVKRQLLELEARKWRAGLLGRPRKSPDDEPSNDQS
jgi:excisionase family DNA binding protein